MRSPGGFAHREFEALGTYAYVATDADVDDAALIAGGILEEIDRTCSRFRPDSDLNRANLNAGSWTRVDPLLAAAVGIAIAAAEETDGLVDPCLGTTLAEIGYDVDLAVVLARTGTRGRLRTRHPVDRWRQLEVDPEGAVKVPTGVRLDLGATAKAWASDLIALSLVEATGGISVVSLGGDVRIATPEDAFGFEGWPVAITEHPPVAAGPAIGAPDEQAELIVLGSGALATSSSCVRRWRVEGVERHHLIDPRTGDPAPSTWRTVTATGPTCVAANVASTAAIVLGAEAQAWLEERDVDARLVSAAGDVTRLGCWPTPEEDER